MGEWMVDVEWMREMFSRKFKQQSEAEDGCVLLIAGGEPIGVY